MTTPTAITGIALFLASIGIGYTLGTAPGDFVRMLPLAGLGLMFGFFFGYVHAAGTFQL